MHLFPYLSAKFLITQQNHFTMTVRQQIQKLVAKEIIIIKHLYTKISDSDWDYRPGENMRSMAELLDYIKHCGTDMPSYYIMGAKEGANGGDMMKAYRAKTAAFPKEEFPQAMDAQEQNIYEILDSISEEELRTTTVKVFWGETITLHELILQSTVKYLTAYRMQLFLYLKMAGNTELNTYNCWLGQEAPKPVDS